MRKTLCLQALCALLSCAALTATAADLPQFVDEQERRVFPAGLSADGLSADGLSSDPLGEQQWHLEAPPAEIAGTGLRAALATPRQLDSVVVAVVDTGILPDHADMGELLPGYDFVSQVVTANDGDGRDPDPTDPGDWVAQADITSGQFGDDCSVAISSWHGTAVTGMLAAANDNALGIAAAAPIVKVLPVRVMGRCGGTVRDLVAGVRWAAGLEVPGVPPNPNPASIINLSLGYHGDCGASMQRAIRDARNAGATVVTAIGNGALSLAEQPYSPASCAGVIAVAAADREGDLAHYNNRGETVDLLAPGGVPGAGLLTLDDGGARDARNDSRYQARYGSSIATPLVSATAALMLAANPLLEPPQIEALLLDNTRPVPDTALCPENSCGRGLLDARLAVHAAANSDVRELRVDDELSGSGGGGSAHPALLLLLLLWCRQGRRPGRGWRR